MESKITMPVSSTRTAIVSHGTIDTNARETYGTGPTILRVGNGGAGATGLIRTLSLDFLNTLPHNSEPRGSIAWVCNHSRNTQLALLNGTIDLALTYERDQECLAESEGWSRTLGCMFHDHFCLAGPAHDPAGVLSHSPPLDSVSEAFSHIARCKALFYSRADMSATMWKERGIWESVGLKPWELQDAEGKAEEDGNEKRWYRTNELSPADALIAADKAGAYLLTDRSTLLSLVRMKKIRNTTVLVEPDKREHVLMNSCYASVATVPVSEERGRIARMFVEYVISEKGQDVVERFGRNVVSDSKNGSGIENTFKDEGQDEDDEFPFFARVDDGFASTFLRRGVPMNGSWRISEML